MRNAKPGLARRPQLDTGRVSKTAAGGGDGEVGDLTAKRLLYRRLVRRLARRARAGMRDACGAQSAPSIEQTLLVKIHRVAVCEADEIDVRVDERLDLQRMRALRFCAHVPGRAPALRALAVHGERADEAERRDARLQITNAVAPHLGGAHAALEQRMLLPRLSRVGDRLRVGQRIRQALVDEAAE